MQNTFGICVQKICLGLLNSLMLNTVKIVLPWQLNFEKNCTDFRHTEKYKNHTEKYKNLRFITVTLLMLKNSKNQCKKLISLKHSVRATAKITVFDPTVCKTTDAPLQNELLC